MEDAVKEMQKPLARYIDDQDLDQMLREKEREGDPMANFIKKKKAKESKDKRGWGVLTLWEFWAPVMHWRARLLLVNA